MNIDNTRNIVPYKGLKEIIITDIINSKPIMEQARVYLIYPSVGSGSPLYLHLYPQDATSSGLIIE